MAYPGWDVRMGELDKLTQITSHALSTRCWQTKQGTKVLFVKKFVARKSLVTNY